MTDNKEKDQVNKEGDQKPKEKETVSVNKKALEDVLARVKKLEEDNEKLTAVADKSRMAWYEGIKPAAKKLAQITVGTYPTKDGYKVILGWPSMPLNEMYQDSNGVFHERQTVELWLEGGEKLLLNYIDFPRRKISIKASVLSRSIDEETGYETLKVETLEGPKKTFDIDSRFINI